MGRLPSELALLYCGGLEGDLSRQMAAPWFGGNRMIRNEDIEIYLDKCQFRYEKLDEGIWKVDVPEDRVEGIVVSHVQPVVIVEVRLMKIPDDVDASFYRRLLEANVQDVTHGAFGIHDKYVVLIDVLESENLDLNEIKASIQSISFSVVQYYKQFTHLALV